MNDFRVYFPDGSNKLVKAAIVVINEVTQQTILSNTLGERVAILPSNYAVIRSEE